MSTRAVVQVSDGCVRKTYGKLVWAKREYYFYKHFPWACPRLIGFDDKRTLTIEALPLAIDHPEWQPVEELKDLLLELYGCGVHHRDVHLGNIVIGHDGEPLLIDWELAIVMHTKFSYDLHGPKQSGVPVPLVHRGEFQAAQWWGSGQRKSIGTEWEA